VKVRVGPSHDELQQVMQSRQSDRGGYQDPPPDRRLDALELDMPLACELP
jgi:hypothetical protein